MKNKKSNPWLALAASSAVVFVLAAGFYLLDGNLDFFASQRQSASLALKNSPRQIKPNPDTIKILGEENISDQKSAVQEEKPSVFQSLDFCDNCITAENIKDQTITGRKIKDGSIDTKQLDGGISLNRLNLGYLNLADNPNRKPGHFSLHQGDAYISGRLEVDKEAYFDSTLYVKDATSISTLNSTTLQTDTANISNILSNSHLAIRGRLPDEDFLNVYDFVNLYFNPSGYVYFGGDAHSSTPAAPAHAGNGDVYVKNDLEVGGTIYGSFAGAFAPSGDVDMDGNRIYNIGSTASGFSATGALTLNDALTVTNGGAQITGNMSLAGNLNVIWNSGKGELRAKIGDANDDPILQGDNIVEVRDTGSTNSHWVGLVATNYKNGQGGYPYQGLYNAGGTLASPTTLGNSQIVGQMVFRGYNSGFKDVALITVTTDGNFTSTNYGKLGIQVGNNRDKVTILSSGNVGIGTTNPQGILDISNSQIVFRIYEGNLAPNILAGYSGNSIGTGANVRANVIAGGGYPGMANHINGEETRYATISGGYDNYIDGISSTCDLDGAASTISGGAHHRLQSCHSTIIGGSYGTIGPDGDYSVVLGGTQNTVLGGGSLAWGQNVTVSANNSAGFGIGYTLNVNNAFGGLFNYYLLTGGNVGVGSFSSASLPGEELDVKGQARIQSSNVSETDGLILYNTYPAAAGDSTTAINIKAGLDNGAGTFIEAGRIKFGEEGDWTSTATRDSYMSFSTKQDNSLSEKIRVTSGGKVGIGTASPSTLLHVVSTSDGNTATIADSDGTCVLDPESGGSWSCTSDERLKKDITPLSNPLDLVLALNPVSYKMKVNNSQSYGFIAQQVQEVYPHAVSVLDDGYLAVAEGKMIPYIVGAIQQQQQQFSIFNAQFFRQSADTANNLRLLNDENVGMDEKITLIGTTLEALSEQISNNKTQILNQIQSINDQNDSQDAQLAELTVSVDGINSFMETANILLSDHEQRIAALENAVLGGQVSVLGASTEARLPVVLEGWSDVLESKAVEFDAKGNFKAKSLEAETLRVGKQVSGKGMIEAGETEVVIETPEASEEAKILITASGNVPDQVLAATDIEDGESFKVEVKYPAEEDIKFNWLIVK